MVRFIKIFAYFVFFVFVFIYFMPKLNFYYYLQNRLQSYKIILSEHSKKDTGFSFLFKDTEIFYDKVPVAKIKKSDLKLFFVYNSISLNNVKLSDMTSSFLPRDIEKIDIVYSIVDPFGVNIYINGGFGKANARIDVLDKNISMVVKPSKIMFLKYKNTLGYLNKINNKEYVYAKNF